MTGYSDEQIEALCRALDTDEYNQGVPRGAPWRTSASCSGTDRWIVYQPTGSDQSRIITEGVRQPFADLIAAARELFPSLLARAQQAEAERDEVKDALADVCCHECRRGTDVTSSEQLARLRAELAEAKAENQRLRSEIGRDQDDAFGTSMSRAERQEMWKKVFDGTEQGSAS